jgi:uroporphyrinogen decarboxylase
MAELTSHERFTRMFNHQEADRIPIIDGPWSATLERWGREGLPEGVSYVDFFGLDRVAHIGAEDYVIATSAWGATLKNWKHAASTPEFLDFTIKDRASWAKAKARMTPDPARVNWTRLAKDYPVWQKEGYWIQAGLWFGFDVTHSWAVGTERVLMAMVEDPEWCLDMFNHYLDVNLALLDMVWEKGYRFDVVSWPDDMGYKYHQFFSIDTYRALVKPVQKRAIAWAHAKGAKAELHSCGNVMPFVPEFIEIGLDGLNPLEVKAGMDPAALKAAYGGRLLLHGGINALLYEDPEALEAEIHRIVPILKERGGYVFSSGHSVPSSVSLAQFRHIVELAKKLGSYA